MGDELRQLCTEYSTEKDSDDCNPNRLKSLRDKLFSAITEKNINDVIDDKGNTLLHYAVFNEDYELTKWLLEHQARIDIRNEHQTTPMRRAINKCFFPGINLLYLHGANVDDTDLSGETGLFSAVRIGQYEKVRLLLALNANVHANDEDGKTIVDMIARLLEKNIDKDIQFKVIRVLLENYIGIGINLDNIDLPQGVADGLPIIFVTKDGQSITSKTPLFENAICDIDKLLQSKHLNFKKLLYVLENVFTPFFPEDPDHSCELRRMIFKENGRVRENNFEAAGPELEKLYKFLRNRIAGVSSLRELATASLIIKHGVRAEKISEPVADDKLTTSTNQPIQPSVNMKLVADAILDPEKLKMVPTDLIDRIESFCDDIAKKLGHTNRADPK